MVSFFGLKIGGDKKKYAPAVSCTPQAPGELIRLVGNMRDTRKNRRNTALSMRVPVLGASELRAPLA
jgi:hypothetical protein